MKNEFKQIPRLSLAEMKKQPSNKRHSIYHAMIANKLNSFRENQNDNSKSKITHKSYSVTSSDDSKSSTITEVASSVSSDSSSSSDTGSVLSNRFTRLSILEFIRKVSVLPEGYLNAFRRCSQQTKNGEYKLKIYGFTTLLSAVLDEELDERNTNALFLTIDKDKNGYIDEDEFVKIVKLSKDPEESK